MNESTTSSTGGATEPGRLPEYNENGQKIERCGTLVYTKRGLFAVFAWLLWGDFCFTLMEAVVPSIVPLKLRSLDASNTVIALLMSTLPGIFNTTVCPWVSFKSDRYRSRWGRRIPFIVATMPFLVAALVFIGFSDSLGGWVHHVFLEGSSIKRNAVIVGVLALFVAMFDLFNMFVASVYWYLFNDVVPERHFGAFMAWFRIVGTLASAGYNYFVFKYALSHMQYIYLGAGLLYLIGFGAMCYKVREGEYPPVESDGEPPSLVKDIRTFAVECFSLRYYWDMFIYGSLTSVGNTVLVFAVFFYQSMGLTLDHYGKLTAIGGVLASVYLLAAGFLVDRWHSVRTEAYLLTFNTVVAASFGLVWLFADAPDVSVYFWVVLIMNGFLALVNAVMGTATLPRQMILFPRDRYGQFCGAQALVKSGAIMVGGLLAGVFLDGVKSHYPEGSLYPYRYIWIWQVAFIIPAYYFYYRVYRAWKRLGGIGGYAPPVGSFNYGGLPPARESGIRKELLIIPTIAFCGLLGVALFFIYYFRTCMPNPGNVWVFGIYTGFLVLAFAFYLRLIKFIERP